MKKEVRLTLIAAVVAALAGGGTVISNLLTDEEHSVLQFSGNIEVTEAQMSFRVGGRLVERLINEGNRVNRGQTLARLDPGDQTVSLALAEANLAYATAVVDELLAGSRPEEIAAAESRVTQARQTLAELQHGSRSEEIASGRAELARARAAEQSALTQVKQAKSDYDRATTLFGNGSISATVFERAETDFETATSQAEEARAKVAAAGEQLVLIEAGPRIEQIAKAEAAVQQVTAEYALIKAGPRQETINQAMAKQRAAKENVNQARQQLKYTELLAAMDGIVLSIAAEPGEYLHAGAPVVTLGQINTPWLRAYINQEDLGRIQLNDKVQVSTDSFPGKFYHGRVSFISSQAEFTPKTVQTFAERVKLMFRIKIELANPDQELKPGMPADGVIDPATRE